MSSDVLYIKIEQNIEVAEADVFLQDIAELSCRNKRIERDLKTLKIIHINAEDKGRFVLSIIQIIENIQAKYPELNIENLGEADFIISYEKNSKKSKTWDISKIVFVCLLTFFGAAFSIMTFNNDADVPGLFAKIYTQVMGQSSDGFTILEFTYSLGVGLGVLIFFNHFANKKLTSDPTPIEIEMRSYETELNNSLIQKSSRKDANQ